MMMKTTVILCSIFVLCIEASYDSNKLLISRRQLESVTHTRVESIFDEFPVHQTNNREKRAPGDSPNYTRSVLLNDNHDFAITVYSGNVSSEVVYVLTYDRSILSGRVTSTDVYKSIDKGVTFEKITSRIGTSTTILLPNIYISPSNKNQVYFIDANTAILYISYNNGDTFTTRLMTPNTINPFTIQPHTIMDNWVLAIDTSNNLYVSQDLGSTPFKQIANNVDVFQWGEYPYDQDKSTVYYISDEIIFTQSYPYDVSTRKVFDDSINAVGILILDRYIFVVKVTETSVSLFVSADRQPFQKAIIPNNYNHERYIVDSIRSLQALVIVHNSINQYNLYFSEETGIHYYQSLSDISVDPDTSRIDLAVTMNFTTYIANQHVNGSIRTLISFDAGANWNTITPPVDNNTDCVKPLCSLHLHMSTSEYWRTGIYSQESAPGIIIAHGVTGQYLNDDNTNLFISRDGGSTWSMTLIGTWGVSVLDHGGLIVAARDNNNNGNISRTIMYTCTEGLSWSPLTVTSNDIIIYGVITEPGETTTIVSLYGKEGAIWVIIVIEFMNIFTSVCDNNDYYNWNPFDQYSDNSCLLGAIVTIERRNSFVCCYNGHTYNRVIDYKTCPCTVEDYECDYGYKHVNGFNGICIKDTSINITCTNTQGYRKIGGDVCLGGIEDDINPIGGTCSNTALASSDNNSYLVPFEIVCVLLIICVIIITGLIVVIVYRPFKNDKPQQFDHQRFTNTEYTVSPPTATIYDTPIDKELEAMKNT